MIDILEPTEQYSVTQYRQTVLSLIKKIQNKGKLPIIVGGTGQYIQSLIEASRETFHIKPNKLLRFFLNKLNTKKIQLIYKLLDKNKYLKLNNSDINNPHRLIRKIEIKLATIFSFCKKNKSLSTNKISNYIHISLTAPNSFLFKNIDQRVDERIKMGLFNEIGNLLKKYSWSDPAFRTHAYKEFSNLITSRNYHHKISPEAIQKWRYDEHRYVHRQKTWFRKMPNVNYFDISSDKYPQNVLDFVFKCYNKL